MNAKKFLSIFIISVLGGFVAIFIFIQVFDFPSKIVVVENEHSDFSSQASLKSNNSFVDLTFAADNSINAVVHVKTKYTVANQPNSLYDFFFGNNYRTYSQPVISSGSGVIISKNGYIITNNHVIDNSQNIEVVLNNKDSYKARIIGRDADTDIALLKIEANDLPLINYGNSDDLRIGEWVLAVGNPFNLNSTVTAGIVSAKARDININSRYSIESFIQTDAAVNPGNSGGALVNTKGELVGINTAIMSKTGSYEGYSFAVPINIVRKVIGDIIEFGEVQRAYLGVSIADLDADISKQLNFSQSNGVVVSKIQENGSADIAGIEIYDIITKINNFEIKNIAQFNEQISKYRPGNKITIEVKRGKRHKILNVILQNRYGETKIVKSAPNEILGAKLKNLSNTELMQLGLSNGVKVSKIKSGKLSNIGIKQDFIIVKINRKSVYNITDVKEIINSGKGGVFIEGIYPNGRYSYYAFK